MIILSPSSRFPRCSDCEAVSVLFPTWADQWFLTEEKNDISSAFSEESKGAMKQTTPRSVYQKKSSKASVACHGCGKRAAVFQCNHCSQPKAILFSTSSFISTASETHRLLCCSSCWSKCHSAELFKVHKPTPITSAMLSGTTLGKRAAPTSTDVSQKTETRTLSDVDGAQSGVRGKKTKGEATMIGDFLADLAGF